MPITVHWEDDAQSILRYEIVGRYTADDMYNAHYQGASMGGAQPHRVDVVIDMREAIGLPASVMRHLGKLAELQTPNTGLCVVVTGDRALHTLFGIAVKVYGRIARYFCLARDGEEALHRIDEARQAAESQLA